MGIIIFVIETNGVVYLGCIYLCYLKLVTKKMYTSMTKKSQPKF